MPPKVVLCFRIDPELRKAIERLALADRRSVSSLIEKVLAEYAAAVEQPKPRKDR